MQTLLFLGDLTDKKDHHSAELVNRVVKEVVSIQVPHKVFLRGNHDWLKNGRCYFEFLSHLPGVQFITQPTDLSLDDGPSALLLPHTRTPGKDWANMGMVGAFHPYVFMHQTYKGAKSSNGQEMDGDAIPDIFDGCKVYSGDIHVPQIIGPVEYVGSPYHVHFGDTFRGRCVLLDRRGRAVDLYPDLLQRHVIDANADVNQFYTTMEQAFEADVRPGDQVKLRIHLTKSELPDWPNLRREMVHVLEQVNLDVRGVEMVLIKAGRERLRAKVQRDSFEEAVRRFADSEQLSASMLDTALDLMGA